jgi:outer membrane receptor protein involved in Fe transport
VAAAKAIRASQLGVLWNPTQGPEYRKTQPEWVLSPSYKFGDNVTGYLSYRHGEKAGISEVVNGVPYLAAPEKSNAYELGVKTWLLEHTLVLNADLFLNDIVNYQQLVQVFDAYTTALHHDGTSYYTAATGNAAKVRSSGLEIDGVWTPIPSFSLRLSGAYDSAVYKDFKNLGQPAESTNLPVAYRNVTGSALPGAAKWTGNLGADFRYPIFSNAVAHTSLNYFYTSRFNSDVTLSNYAWVPGYGIADLSIGLSRADEKFDLSVLAKNLFNNQTSQVVTWNSYIPAVPRWVGVQFSARL